MLIAHYAEYSYSECRRQITDSVFLSEADFQSLNKLERLSTSGSVALLKDSWSKILIDIVIPSLKCYV